MSLSASTSSPSPPLLFVSDPFRDWQLTPWQRLQPIYNSFDHGQEGYKVLGSALWVGAIICGLSLLTAVAAAYLDKVGGERTD